VGDGLYGWGSIPGRERSLETTHTPIVFSLHQILLKLRRQGLIIIIMIIIIIIIHLCGLVVRVPGYRYRGPSSIPGATRFSEK
jgi:hypothetical protein